MRLIDGDALMYEANSDGAYGYVDAKQISEAPQLTLFRWSDAGIAITVTQRTITATIQ